MTAPSLINASELPDVGDLAIVVRACCAAGERDNLGAIIRVSVLFSNSWTCADCGRHPVEPVVQYAGCARDSCLPQSWLKKIPPLNELESMDVVSEIESERPKRVEVTA